VVDVKIYDDPTELNNTWQLAGEYGEVWGFTEQDVTPNKIHVPRLVDEFDGDTVDTWGHELLHVVCGDWHSDDAEY
jgi:hypothetical protein